MLGCKQFVLCCAGEHMDEFENFDSKAFVGRLLGKGDWSGFMDKVKVYPPANAGSPLGKLLLMCALRHHCPGSWSC